MQNKNAKPNADHKRSQKITKVVAPIIKSRIVFTHHSQFNENIRVSSSHNIVVPYMEGNSNITDDVTKEKLQVWYNSMMQTFEKFLLQLDELFTSLRTEKRSKVLLCAPIMNNYKDICEKLRMEILIAIDKLELTNTTINKNDKDIKMLEKMNALKSQLSQVRWQYHQAIQDWSSSRK